MPAPEIEVLVDDITGFVNGRNKELVEMAEKVLKKLKMVAEEKGLKLSITEGGKKDRARRSLQASFWRRGFRNAARKNEDQAVSKS